MSYSKFRAWHRKRKCWLDEYEFNIYPDGSVFEIDSEGGVSSLPDVELVRYTGLSDKHDVEIYEGDILQFPPLTHQTADVFYREGSFCTYIDAGAWLELSQNSFGGDVLVIGNIYENPELLKGGDTEAQQ